MYNRTQERHEARGYTMIRICRCGSGARADFVLFVCCGKPEGGGECVCACEVSEKRVGVMRQIREVVKETSVPEKKK
jgi:hypothetical protein